MHKRFSSYIKSEKLFGKADKILVAVSGGMDSMTLVDLLRHTHPNFSIAHFNHMTRNGESDLDEAFVMEYARAHNIPFYSTQMEIQAIIDKDGGGNFQSVARMYRYNWLEQLRKELDHDYIATAHHHNDQIETFLFHFSRGTGLDGLTGISAKQNNIIRPMLVFTRQEIETYVFNKKIEYRIDSSNASSKYSRNYIRHGIIPSFKILNDNFENNANTTIENLRAAKALYDYLLNQIKADRLIEKKPGVYSLDSGIFKGIPDIISHQLCFEMIREFGFNFSQACQITESCNQRGKIFYSDDHTLLIEKDECLVRKTKAAIRINQLFESDCKVPGYGLLTMEKTRVTDPNIQNSNIEYVDLDKLSFPLMIRNKEEGDRFKPLGMKGKTKKLKDFFTDIKLNKFEKDRALVLLNDNKIVWVLGYRLSENYKITKKTKNILKLEWIPELN
jgi:tRNA(Ile)-lysidine synthase